MHHDRPRLHPVTVLAVAASAWFLVLGANNPVVSAIVVTAGCLIGGITTRSWGVLAATVALSIPTGLSMFIIHAPYGDHQLTRFVTSDGLATAGALTLRFAALMACLLCAVIFLHVPDLAKVMQRSWLGYKASYVVAASLQAIPQGARAVGTVRDANQLAGNPRNVKTVVPKFALPVITKLIVEGTSRGEALASSGFDLPGRRTVMRPVTMRSAELVSAIVWPIVAIALVVAL